MFTEIRLKNFKSFEELEIQPRLLTVFVGPNGSGKSSVLQSLVIWKESAGGSGLKTTGETFDLGSAEDVRRSVDKGPVWLGFTCNQDVFLQKLHRPDQTVRVVASADAVIGGGQSAEARVISKPFEYIVTRGEAGRQPVVKVNPIDVGGVSYTVQYDGRLPALVSQTSRGSAAPAPDVLDELNMVIGAASKQLQRIRVVPPTRGFMSARYPLGRDRFDDVTVSRESYQNAETLATTLAYDSSLRERVSGLMSKLTGVAVGHTLEPDKLVSPVSRRETAGGANKDVVPTNEGFGTNQLIHLVSQVLLTPAGGTTLIEEPETHLHPGSQVKLAEWLAEHAVAHNQQLIVATHSEHFLAGLLWQVRQEVIDPGQIALFYAELGPDGDSKVRRHDVTQGGVSQGSYREFFSGPEDYPGFDKFFRGLRYPPRKK